MNKSNERFTDLFKNHVATLTEAGNIKILDFKQPDSNEFAIRFTFEEDRYLLNISGDLGYLTAVNNSNMVYDKFERDFANNIGYFKEKIRSHERPLSHYSEDAAYEDIIEHLKEYEIYNDVIESYKAIYSYIDSFTDEDALKSFMSDMLADFDDERGCSAVAEETLAEYESDAWEIIDSFGKRDTDILEIYMIAFKLAKEQIDKKEYDVSHELTYEDGREDMVKEILGKFHPCTYCNAPDETDIDGKSCCENGRWSEDCFDSDLLLKENFGIQTYRQLRDWLYGALEDGRTA